MVGLFGLGSRHSPPADTRRSVASDFVTNPKPTSSTAEQTFLSSSVDNPSGGFFSLPYWTRRMLPVSSSTRKSLAGLPQADVHHANLQSMSAYKLLLEKDLPPIPSPPANASTTHPEPRDRLHDVQSSVSTPRVRDTSTHPTFRLDNHNHTPMNTSPQASSVVFTPFPSNSTENVLRKSKSTLSLRPEQATPIEQQRSRGVSMTQTFTKAKRVSTSPASGNSSRPPVRKSSFWSRKFSTSFPRHLAESPSLPVFKPTSPLRMDFIPPSDSFSRSRSSSIGAGLSRRHSERAVRRQPMAQTNTPCLPQSPVSPDRTNVRPSTANSHLHASHRLPTRRPTTADSAAPSRSRSFFALSLQSTSPHLNDEPLPTSPMSRSKIGSRPRSTTNPPLLHRLSVNLFTSSSSSTTKYGTFSNGVASIPSSRSPRPSLSQIPPDVLKPRAGESSETFLNRMASLVSKAEIAGILASAGDATYVDSLKLFLDRFGFRGDPLDVALRRLLMDVGLPRETQQIDRVIQAFANRYLSCNPDVFTSRDHPYILAFSLIMLHTDAFNKSNRRKMSKVDYMKNTNLPGLIPEVLDCFYDNIVFAPFIFIEDPLEPEASAEGNLTRPSTSSGLSSPMIQSGNTLLSRPKIDPYYLITNNLLDQLRVDVDRQVSLENPYRWDGTGASWDYDEILLSFTEGHVVQITSTDTRSATPFFGLSVGTVPTPSVDGLSSVPEMLPASEPWTIRFTKVGVLNRKDDSLEGRKKPLNRKWRLYSVVLTRSQLLLFRDLSWSTTLPSWNDQPRKPPLPSTSFKPDEIISLNNALAVLDRSYSKHLNTFRVTTGDGRHILLQATEEKEMDEWISRINYASAFKTADIRMRSLAMTSKVLELTGVAAAASHLHDLRARYSGQPRTLAWDHRNLCGSMDMLHGVLQNGCCVNVDGCRTKLADISAPEVEGASQFKDTFDTVKAELAVARISARKLSVTEKFHSIGMSPRLASRSHVIHTRVEDLESRICATNAQIDLDMHIARNIAILAPFQKSTRDRLQDTVQTLSKKIHAMRMEVTKLMCHRNILLNDLAAEEKNFRQATSLALQAATETLHQRYPECASQSSISSQGHRSKSSSQEEAVSTRSQSFDSPTCDTFRTALDFGPDWPSSGEAFAASSLWGLSVVTDSPTSQGFNHSTGCSPSPDETSYLSLSTSNRSLPETPDFAEEQAEEWDKTRAAKRVSLVKLPSDLRMTVIASKPCGPGQDNNPLKEDELGVYGT